jgi:hypothetical protein
VSDLTDRVHSAKPVLKLRRAKFRDPGFHKYFDSVHSRNPMFMGTFAPLSHWHAADDADATGLGNTVRYTETGTSLSFD